MDFDRRQIIAAAICASASASSGVLAASGKVSKEKNMTEIKTYSAVAMQLAARSIENAPDKATARTQMMDLIKEVEGKIRSSCIFIQIGRAHV